MTKVDIAALALRLLGIYVLAQTLLTMPVLTAIIQQAQGLPASGIAIDWTLRASQILPIGAVLVGAFILIARGDRVALWLFDTPNEPASVRFSREDALTIGISLIGASLLARAVPQLANLCMWLSIEPDSLFNTAHQRWALGAEIAAQLIVGAAMFFGSRGIANAWRTLRQLGQP